MNRRRSLSIALISGLLAAVLVYVIYQLQLKQLELETRIAVSVPAHFIDAGTVIKHDMLKTAYMTRASLASGVVGQADDMIGLAALIPLGKDEPVLAWKVSEFYLSPMKGESTFQIPRNYVLSISNGIRAGDRVRLYLSGLQGSEQLLAREVIVASVKTAANTEVGNAGHSDLLARARGDREMLYASRRDANGAIEFINLNLTGEEWMVIDEQCRGGQGKLVIAFASSYWGAPEADAVEGGMEGG